MGETHLCANLEVVAQRHADFDGASISKLDTRVLEGSQVVHDFLERIRCPIEVNRLHLHVSTFLHHGFHHLLAIHWARLLGEDLFQVVRTLLRCLGRLGSLCHFSHERRLVEQVLNHGALEGKERLASHKEAFGVFARFFHV